MSSFIILEVILPILIVVGLIVVLAFTVLDA